MARKKQRTASAASFKVRYLRRSRQQYRRYLELKPWIKQFHKSLLKLRPGLRIVDVGCGTGDFTRYLGELIDAKCNIIGVDMRAASLRTAAAETRKAGLAGRISFRKGDAYKIPVEDGYADLACCRTLLMHLVDPLKAVREMVRVTKTGGTVAAVERGQMHAFYDPLDEEWVELAERMGKAGVKGTRKIEGKDFAIGEKLPSIFQKAGLKDIVAEVQADAWVNCDPRRNLQDIKDELRLELEVFKETQSHDRKVMMAGGARGEEITQYFRKFATKIRALLSDDARLRKDTTLYAGGLFLVSGRKE